MHIILTDEQVKLLETYGAKLIANPSDAGVHFFLPFWFKDIGDNKFEMYHLDDLPEYLIEELSDFGYMYKRVPNIQIEEEIEDAQTE